MPKLKGLIVPLLTPYKDGQIHPESIEKLVNYVQTRGATGLFPSSTTGESILLASRERALLLDTVLKNAKTFVWAGIPQPSTKEAIEEAQAAIDAGAHGVVLYTPYYYRHPEDKLYKHWSTILERIETPAIIYLIPSHTCNKPTPQTIGKLAREHSNLAGVKVTTPDVSYLVSIIEALEDTDTTVLPGDARLTPVAAQLGHNAAILGIGNLLPRTAFRMLDELAQGKNSPSYRKIARAVQLTSRGRPQCILKTSLQTLGIIYTNKCREPIGRPTKEETMLGEQLAREAKEE